MIEIEMVCTAQIITNDAPADWLSRVTTADFPYKRLTATGSRPLTEREGLEHLAFNAVANGIEDASRLDGWADIEPGAVTMRLQNVEATR